MDKAFGTLSADIKVGAGGNNGLKEGMFEAILSMPTVDRDGEVIDSKAFDPLPDHITIDIDHGMSTATTVGSGVPYYEGDVLKLRGSFASTPTAQEVRTLVTEGHVRKMSVAYMNAHYEDGEDGRPHLRSAELLNAAIVPIPSNREASILAAKAAKAAADQALEAEEITTEPVEQAAAPAPAKTFDVEVAKATAVLAEAHLLLA